MAIKWVEAGWAEPDGDGVNIVSVSGGEEYRSRVSWHQFIKYHMESERIIAEHLAAGNVIKIDPACKSCNPRAGPH